MDSARPNVRRSVACRCHVDARGKAVVSEAFEYQAPFSSCFASSQTAILRFRCNMVPHY